MTFFTLLIGATSLIIAGCAAYFSVRGIGLLFSGFMVPVMIMAASLELGKLVTASFLYRQWKKMHFFMKFYLTTAVLVLIGITSLGIYGYLSDAFDKTNTRVALYESNIEQLQSKNKYLKEQIESTNNAADTVDDKANEAIENFQKIYDDFIARQDKRKQSLDERLAVLNKERDALEASPGGLFSNKKKKIEDLKLAQASDRSSITDTIATIEKENKEQYDSFLKKVEDLRNKTGEVDVRQDVDSYYTEIKTNEDEILNLKELIGNTDIGSFKFIARTFGMELEQVVKWFMIIIVVVFDPLAVCLVVGYNSMLTNKPKKDVIVNNFNKNDSVKTKEEVKEKPKELPKEEMTPEKEEENLEEFSESVDGLNLNYAGRKALKLLEKKASNTKGFSSSKFINDIKKFFK